MTTERRRQSELHAFEQYSGEIQQLAKDLLADDWLAEDVVQEVWLASQRNAPNLPTTRRAWLRGIAWNVSQSIRRDRARRQFREKRASRSEALELDPSGALERETLRGRLTDAIAALDEPYADTLRCYYFEGLTAAEISKRFARPVPTVRTHLQRGLQRLREDLGRKVGGQRALALGLVDLFRWSPSDLAAGGIRRLSWWARGMGSLGAGLPAIALLLVTIAVVGVGLQMERKPETGSDLRQKIARVETLAESAPGASRSNAAVQQIPTASIPSGESPRRTLPISEDKGAVVPSAASFTLRVVDDLGAPMPGARLWEGPVDSMVPVGVSDDAGRLQPDTGAWTPQPLRLSTGPTTGYFIRASAAGFADSRIYYVAPEELDSHALELQLVGPGAEVEGVVRDDAGNPIRGAKVRQIWRTSTRKWQPGFGIIRHDLQARSDALGRFRLQGSQAIHTLVVTAPGFAPSWIAVDARQRNQVSCEVELSEGHSVVGELLDPSGEPVGGIPLTLRWLQRSFLEPVDLLSNSEGRFEAANLPPGRVRVTAGYGEFHVEQDWQLGDRETLETTLTLKPAPLVLVRLVDRDQKPIAGYRIDLMTPHGEWTRFFEITDSDGIIRVDSWPGLPVRAVVRASTDQVPLFTQVLDSPGADGITIVCDRQFESTGNLRGAVDLSWLERPAEATLVLSHLSARTNVHPKAFRGGSFYFTGLPPATYELLLVANPHGRWRLSPLDLQGEDADLGPLAIPPMGRLEIDWDVPNIEDTFFRIRQMYTDGMGRHGFFSLAEGRGAPAPHWTLFPGSYVVIANTSEGQSVMARFVTILPGESSHLRMHPDGPIRVTFEVHAPETGLGSPTVELYRLESEFVQPEDWGQWVSGRIPALTAEARPSWNGHLQGSFEVDAPDRWVAALRRPDGSAALRLLTRDEDYELWHQVWDVASE